MTSTAEVRASFLKYFETKGHSIVASSSLVPAGDPTLLFTNAGMVQFKDVFLGTDKRPYVRAATVQKCLRISGKHNDLENVGRTARHHTFFEMLGNFSFGDYFKEDAIKFAWEYLTVVLKLPKDRLWATVYTDDDEAASLWRKHTDIGEGRILRFGKEDNFWAMGETGPCGPCSEVHYYLGTDLKQQSEEDFRRADGSYLEIWNLVFMQYNRDTNGTLHPLPKPSVDTGMGLERIAAVKQGVLANYDIDSLREIIRFIEKLSGRSYAGESYVTQDLHRNEQYAIDVAMRVVTDHARACAFLIADQVSPGSDGRGYVLRRLIRRACRHGRALGFQKPFLYQVAIKVCEIYGDAYPELRHAEKQLSVVIAGEEERFIATLESGMSLIEGEIAATKAAHRAILSGEVAFVLHDTYGFPLDLTEDLARGHGLTVDVERFHQEMEQQRERSRQARASQTDLILTRVVTPVVSSFLGYDYLEYQSEVVGLFNQSGDLQVAKAGAEVAVLTRETPFYGESGGQVGDTGTIGSNNGSLDVIDTQKLTSGSIVHICRVIEGEIPFGDKVRLAVDRPRREKLRLNHSATHLLHQALREILGDHVKQAGSKVSDRMFRFDFSHGEPLTESQLEQIEARVNELIRENNQVVTELLPLEQAKRSGAIALFGEKYGEQVRVVQIGPGSRELCGGTHAVRSGDIGVFTVLGESGIAAGVRRIEAGAGIGGYDAIVSRQRALREIADLLHVPEARVPERVRRIGERSRELEQQLSRMNSQASAKSGAELASRARTLASGVRVVTGLVEDASPDQLRALADDLRGRLGSACVALASITNGKAIFLTAVTDDLTKRFHAGKMVEEMAKIVGSRGGGRPDLAQAGGGDPEKIDLALKRFEELVR